MENEKKQEEKNFLKVIDWIIDAAKLSMLAAILVLVIRIYMRG